MLQAKRLTRSNFFRIITGWFTLMGFTSIAAFAQLGEIVSAVPCLENEAQTYALYRPSNYTRKKRWPAILLLDPKGQGQIALEAFRKGAETYGFILASPNGLNANREMEGQYEVVRQIFEDLIRRFAVDFEAVYAGGLGKASPVAINFAERVQITPGLVLCSPEASALAALATISQPLAISVGTRDANASSALAWCESHAANNSRRVLQFTGGTQWPSAETGEEILGWLALRQWRARPDTEPKGGLKRSYEIRASRARELEAGRWWTEALASWQSLATDFPKDGHQPPADVEAQRLAKSPSLKEQAAAESEARRMEGQVLAIFQQQFQPGFGTRPQAMAENLAWWQAQIASLRHIADLPDQDAKKNAAMRLIEWIWRRSYLDGLKFLENSEFQRAAYHQQLASQLFPDQAFAHYANACALAGLKQPEAAIEALEKSLNAGLNQVDLLRLQPLFDPLRDQVAFQALEDRIAKKTH